MASYAAVLSLFHTLDNIQTHPRPPISLDQQQLHSLTENIKVFLDFFEHYSSEEDDELECRIARAANATEDVIETRIVNQIETAGSTTGHGENISSVDFSQGLKRVIQDMNLIRGEVMEIIQEKIRMPQHQDLQSDFSDSTASGEHASMWTSGTPSVFDDAIVKQVLDKLTGQQSSLQVIPIVGMGGIGKTTFARNIYLNSLTVEHFEIRAWVTISQEYNRRNILQVLCRETKASNKGFSELSEDEIGDILRKHLWSRRYLIVMDDIWSAEAWDEVRAFFPDNNNGSRIMITTRLSNLAFDLSGSQVLQMEFLDENKSWYLFCAIVFGKPECPFYLEYIGKEISRKCRGLPLSIVVIGGLLKKSNMTEAFWLYTLENLNLLINLGNDEYILRVLRTSYKELPMHLKPCFLYMGIFPEDGEIKMSVLIKLWVAEGILRPIHGKSLEEVGKEYLKELIQRNLILISKLYWYGKPRLCKIHDLLRDLCVREASKQKFFYVLRQQIGHTPQAQDINMERRIRVIDQEYSYEVLRATESASLTRSLLYNRHENDDHEAALLSLRFGLMRVYSSVDGYCVVTDSNTAIFKQANLRYLSVILDFQDAAAAPRLLSLCSLFWNLRTLKVDGLYFMDTVVAFDIWKMSLLRHVKLSEFVLLDPPNGKDNIVLKNLQALSGVINLKLSDEVVKRMPNVKKLKVFYGRTGLDDSEELLNFCHNNLGCLQKLESLDLGVAISNHYDLENVRRNLVSFPHSLKKLSLRCTRLNWKDMTERIGSLPVLQILRLCSGACVGPKWEPIEGGFCCLKVLQIDSCEELEYWETTDDSHFPCLEHLRLSFLENLVEIPSSIGDIPTLKLIQVEYCNETAADSAEGIKEEQEGNDNKDLHVVIVQ